MSTCAPTPWVGEDTIQITGTSFGIAGTSQASNKLFATISGGGDIVVDGCRVTVEHTQVECNTKCATVCNTVVAGTTRLSYRDVAVEVGLTIATGPGAGTRLDSGTTGNGKLKLIGPVIGSVTGGVSGMLNKLSFFPASDPLKVTGLNFGAVNAGDGSAACDGTNDGSCDDGSTVNFIGVCSKSNVSLCTPYPFVITGNDYGDFGTPAHPFLKNILNTEIETNISARYGKDFSVLVQIAGVTSDDAEDTGFVLGTTTAVGSKLLDFIGPELNNIPDGHGILSDGTKGMTVETQALVTGKRFGPTGNAQYATGCTTNCTQQIRFMNWDGKELPSPNAAVTVLDSAMTFDVPEGVGTITFYVVMNNGIGDISSATATFTYTAPTITAVSDVAAGGGTLTITGTSFGVVGSASITGLVLVGATTCESAAVSVAHKQITCTMPPGTGMTQNVNFKIGEQAASGRAVRVDNIKTRVESAYDFSA